MLYVATGRTGWIAVGLLLAVAGLGCLKGCLFTIVILFVAGWLVWELTPLQGWIGTGKGYWEQLSDWTQEVSKWVKDLGGGSGGN
ncbi:serine/threonine protein kinase [Streptomyces sp. NTH33]|nr:serine/threonine protein kinase [Streptomyces sp. NTH33]